MKKKPSVLLINDTRVDQHHGCTAVMATIESMISHSGMSLASCWPAHIDWQKAPSFEAAAAESQLIIINGEGTIHHDRPAGQRLLKIGAFARALGIPAALINTGWEANSFNMLSMLDDFSLIAARDSRSATEMRTENTSVRVVPDLSLCTMWPMGAEIRAGIGVTDNVNRIRALELERTRRQIDGKTISITWPGSKSYFSYLRSGMALAQDLRAPLRILSLLRMRHRQYQHATGNLPDFLKQLTELKLLVSGRFHACALSLVTATPFVAQPSNTGKIAALIADAGIEKWRGMTSLDPTMLQEAVNYGWSSSEKEARLEFLGRAKRDAVNLFADLRRLV